MKRTEFRIEPLSLIYVNGVIGMLQDISQFVPSTDYEVLFEKHQAQSNVYSLVGIKEGELVAYGSGLIYLNIRGGKFMQLEDIVVSSKYRKIGIGRLILSKLTEIAEENNCYKVILACKSLNLNFYESCGFELDGHSMKLGI